MADNKTQIVITAKDETRAAIASAQQGLQSLTTGAAGLGLQLGALGGAASLGGLALMAKQAIDAADGLGKMAQKVGVSVESLAALEYAGKLSDVTLDQLGTGLKKLSVNLNEIASGGDNDAAAALKALGVGVTDASGKLRNADAVFADVAEAFAGMEDGAGKTALAVAIFGKSGAELIPMLNAGADGLQNMREEATALGLVFDGDMAKQAEAFNDDLTRLSEAARGVGVAVASAVLPSLSELSKSFVEASKESTGFAQGMSTVLKLGLETVAILGREVAFVFEVAGNNVAALAASLQALASGNFSGVAAIGSAWLENIKKARAEADAFADRLINPRAPEAAAVREQRAAPVFGGSSGAGRAGRAGRESDPEAERRDAMIAMAKEANKELEEIGKEREKAERDLENRLRDLLGATTSYRLAQYEKQREALYAALQVGEIDTSQFTEAMAVIDDSISKLTEDGKDKFKDLERAIEGWGKASADAFVEFAFTGKTSFSDMVQSILKDLAKMVVYQNVTKPLADGVSKSISDAGGIGGFFSSLFGSFGGGRASGGPVIPGQYYVVGENGPEVLVPGTAGTVIPNGGMGGGNVVSNVTVNMNGGGTAEGDPGTARELGRRIEAAVRSVIMTEQRPGGMLSGA